MCAVRIKGPARPRGVALLVTVIFVALFACMAVALVTLADTNMVIGRNRLQINQAAALADIGLFLAQRELGGLPVSGQDAASVHDEIADHFRAAWSGSAMVDTGSISADAARAVIPLISLPSGQGPDASIELVIAADGGADEASSILVQSTGRFGNAVRTARYNLGFDSAMAAINKYAITTRSEILMEDNAVIQGANNDAEGSVLSATAGVTNAIDMSGDSRISGDAAAVDPDANIRVIDNATIDGDRITGAAEPEWPTVEIAEFAQYVENIVAGDVSNATLHNIRIAAGTNPTFSGNINLYGVVYVEAPNKVTFTGTTNICGVIVAEEPAVENLDDNQIRFYGNLTASGVENLPDEPHYDGLRARTGSFILAPGFTVKFADAFNTINDCMAAGKFAFRDSAAGTIGGPILNLNDSLVRLRHNASLTIDKSATNPHPAGLSAGYTLVCLRGSYRE